MTKAQRRDQTAALASNGMAPFPMVSDRDHAAGRSYAALWQRWRNAPMVGLHVRAEMGAGYVSTVGALNLDGVMAAGLVNSPMVGATMGGRDGFCVPLPLQLAWVSDRGWPMWAATEFVAASAQTGQAYLHKRHPTDRAPLGARQAVNTSAGQFKDVRLPLQVRVTEALDAWCIGAADDVRAILSSVTHIGRKGAIGYGRVLRWKVEPADVSLAWVLDRRAVPLAACGDADPGRVSPRDAWTAPYWDASRHLPVRVAKWTN